MRRVFFLTYYFPPLGGVAALRALKFAKYLPEFGWQPVVFHAGPGHLYLQDPSLLEELPPAVRRIPVRTFEGAAVLKTLSRMKLRFVTARVPRLYPLDPQIGWLPGLLRAVRAEAAAHGKPDVLFSSAAPVSVNVAGLALRRELGVPWHADFRDEWTRLPGLRYLTPLHAKMARKYELDTLAAADAVSSVTQTCVDGFQQDRPVGKRPVDLLYNGFDEADFAATAPARPQDKWTLAIVGTVYQATWPTAVLDALAELTAQGKIDPSTVRVVHAGNGSVDWPRGARFEHRSLGFMAHGEAVAWMRRAHLLLLTIERAGALSGRVFEYLRSGTPVLGAAPVEGEAARLVHETGAGRIYAPADAAGLREGLLARYDAWRRGEPPTGAPAEKIAFLTRRAQTEKLASIFEAIGR